MPVPIQLLYNHVGRSSQTNEHFHWTLHLQCFNGQSIYLDLDAKTVDIKAMKVLNNNVTSIFNYQ